MIVATAGHVDHGKTALIKQLTGVETDRLEEERRRGLSINLGYAYLAHAGDTPLGFIDVPGHRRFINTMISGISGIDLGMLVVAADDGPMPQTHEHLDVLELLGVEELIVVVTKIDRVDHGQQSTVEQELAAITEQRCWPGCEIFAVSNNTGDGIQVLRNFLLERAGQARASKNQGYFKLSVDRSFTVKGAGLVVTGTAAAGEVSVGDRLSLLPAGTEVRVRGIRAHDVAVAKAVGGQRVALNIAARLEANDIGRGSWLTAAEISLGSRRLDVGFTLLPGAPFALKHLAPVKLHLGAKRVAGRLALLDPAGGRLEPGQQCRVQLVLDEIVMSLRGERFLLRDHAENVILGGGSVIDPLATRPGKNREDRLAWLDALAKPTITDVLRALIEQGRLVDLGQLGKISNLRLDDVQASARQLGQVFSREGKDWLTSISLWEKACSDIAGCVHQWHMGNPGEPGMRVSALKRNMESRYESPLVMAALVARLEAGELVLHEGYISEKGFKPAVSDTKARHWRLIQSVLENDGSQVPLLADVLQRTGLAAEEAMAAVKMAEKNKALCRLSDTRYVLPSQLLSFAESLLATATSGDPLTVVAAKEQFGTGRKLAIEVLEYFDGVRFTRRDGDIRHILDPALPRRLFAR